MFLLFTCLQLRRGKFYEGGPPLRQQFMKLSEIAECLRNTGLEARQLLRIFAANILDSYKILRVLPSGIEIEFHTLQHCNC
jgi:hypothetical protein